VKRAVDEYFIGGVKTNLSLFRGILNDPAFAAGNTDTGYLGRLPGADQSESEGEQELAAIAAAIFAMLDSRHGGPENGSVTAASSTWKRTARAEALGSETLR
jgi:acetyl-CoA carboxylase biotin carboxylase subunit